MVEHATAGRAEIAPRPNAFQETPRWSCRRRREPVPPAGRQWCLSLPATGFSSPRRQRRGMSAARLRRSPACRARHRAGIPGAGRRNERSGRRRAAVSADERWTVVAGRSTIWRHDEGRRHDDRRDDPVDAGKLRLDDAVVKYIPEFTGGEGSDHDPYAARASPGAGRRDLCAWRRRLRKVRRVI